MITSLLALHARDPSALEQTFGHLTAPALASLEGNLGGPSPSTARLIGCALLRRKVHAVLEKRKHFGDVNAGLSIVLPHALRDRIVERYGGRPPTNWLDCLSRIRELAGGSSERLWEHVISHPMTEYVPHQCQHCGHVVPDETSPGNSDEEVGLTEEPPTSDELPFARAGYYRGPRSAVVFVLRCPVCGGRSRWFRSSAAQVILNPHRWGRLCGEQEDLRAALAQHLQVPLRAILPLDWDHVWSETRRDADGRWIACQGPGEAPASNFAGRLDEGIGAWTRVLAISHEEEHTCDVTEEYLSCTATGGRADATLESQLPRFREAVQSARDDSGGELTQAKTVNGHVLHRAGFGSCEVTAILRDAVRDHGVRGWWECDLFDTHSFTTGCHSLRTGPVSILPDATLLSAIELALPKGHMDCTREVGSYSIEDVPVSALLENRELVMVVLADRARHRVLLEVGNDLGWRLHFGCVGLTAREDATVDERWAVAEEAAATELTAAGVIQKGTHLRRAGLMLFSFPSHLPMRVRVFEAVPATTVPSQQLPGVYYDFEQVPYDRMWADDAVWMPTLLDSETSYFEGHFVFDGGPGATCKLVQHNWCALR